MKYYLIFILFVALSTVGKPQIFDSTFYHSKEVASGYKDHKNPIGYILIEDGKKEVFKIESHCKCEKKVKENKIAIQIEKTFPSDSFKKRYLVDAKNLANRFLMNYAWYKDSLDFQVSQITIYLTGNKVDSAIIKRVSEEAQFEGKYRVSADINYFNISITKANYHVASDIWGVAKLKMPIPFGWTENDKIVNIYFRCNNSRIEQTVELPSFDDGHYPHGKN